MNHYSIRINRALNFALGALPRQVELEEVASHAAFSAYHFHRVFLLVVGESFGCFMRKRRLTWAARALLMSKRGILEVALDAGYETQGAFSRAFKAQFAVTPGQFRRQNTAMALSSSGEVFINNLESGVFMQPELIYCDRFVAAGLQQDYPAPDFAGALTQWREFDVRSREIEGVETNTQTKARRYGLTMVPTVVRQAQQCSGVFTYLAAYEVGPDARIPQGMARVDIPPQTYAKYRYKGPISGFQSFILNVWMHYLPDSGLEAIASPEIEVYGAGFDLNSNTSEMDYLVAVKA